MPRWYKQLAAWNKKHGEAVQFLMLWGGAYALTGHRSEGMVSALLYFVLRLNISNGETSNVCFEEV